ncbi:hypothetical protein FGO68_gene9422 [Halteria grandinella]|uniref:TLC domain-containing protein n=1 Tax=Halteria grandinella TaxID=5974 RepID=A0A8J8NR96_HALGN|nr:hypothetical protein FGO68_gene9422 [Halteria grandinella]
MPADYRWPQLHDFWFTIVTTIVLGSLERAFEYFLYDWFYDICKEKNNLEERDRRTRKAIQNMYKCCYYLSATVFGYLTLKDSYILPPGMGGSGSLWNQFKDFPYIEHPPLYRFYFTGTMGYHVGGLLNQFFQKKKHNDYIEMMFHHLVTAYLYTFSYMTNTLIGAVVSFLHDCTDVSVAWTRIWAETKHSRVTAYSFVVAQILWSYFRVFWLSQCIYVSTMQIEVYTLSPILQPIFGFLLSCLLVLHIYWQYLMIGILFNYANKGVAEDTVNNIKQVVSTDCESEEEKMKKGGKALISDSGATPSKASPERKEKNE